MLAYTQEPAAAAMAPAAANAVLPEAAAQPEAQPMYTSGSATEEAKVDDSTPSSSPNGAAAENVGTTRRRDNAAAEPTASESDLSVIRNNEISLTNEEDLNAQNSTQSSKCFRRNSPATRDNEISLTNDRDLIARQSSESNKLAHKGDLTGYILDDSGRGSLNFSDAESSMMLNLLLRTFLDLMDVAPSPVLLYKPHSIESTSEQDYVGYIAPLPPEHREALKGSEAKRLHTYVSGSLLRLDFVSPKELAVLEFYYKGILDYFKCIFYRDKRCNLLRGDSAMREHWIHFSNCCLAIGLESGNKSIASERLVSGITIAFLSRGGQAILYAATVSEKEITASLSHEQCGSEKLPWTCTFNAVTRHTDDGYDAEWRPYWQARKRSCSQSNPANGTAAIITPSVDRSANSATPVLPSDVASQTGNDLKLETAATPALNAAGSSLPTAGRESASGEAAVPFAVAASRPSETSMPLRFTGQRSETDRFSGPSALAHGSRAAPDMKTQLEPPPSERPLASLHEKISCGLLDAQDGDTAKDIFNSSACKSAMFTTLLTYALHISDSVSEQDYVRNLMALPREERESLMKSEAERLRTYGSDLWPIRDVMPPEELAASGFYYTGVHDRVQCAFCRGVLRSWERGDSAIQAHRVHFSYCRLVMGLDCGNIPVASGQPTGGNVSTVQSRIGQVNRLPTADRPLVGVYGSSSPTTMLSGEQPSGISDEKCMHRFISTQKPKSYEHATEARRLQSFGTWPLWALQSPENLAKAGFYYAGCSDSVKCFYCHGSLRSWELMDNPWEEHARWFKNCKYLLDVKGRAYVDAIQKKYAVGNEATQSEVTASAATSKTSPRSLLEHPSVVLVNSMGYSVDQIMAALKHFYPQHQTGAMPKGAELLDAVLKMNEGALEARRTSSTAGRSLPTARRLSASGTATSSFAVATARTLETAAVSSHFVYQRLELNGKIGPSSSASSNGTTPDVKRKPELPPSARPLASLHDIVFTGLLNVPEEERCLEENRQMREHLECKACRQRQAEVVLLPCHHFSSCQNCVPQLRKCPHCATPIQGEIRTYLC